MRTHTFMFVIFIIIVAGMPFSVHATVSEPFIYSAGVVNMPMIFGVRYGTYQTALRAGDTPILQTLVHSRYGAPTISADLSAFGLHSSATTTGVWGGYGVKYYPAYSYTFNPFTISSSTPDGLYEIPITAMDTVGSTSSMTLNVRVDNDPPTILLSDISFSTTSPKIGDTMYLSGKADGTGSPLTIYEIRETLWDAQWNPIWPPGGGINYAPSVLTEDIATSTDGSFARVPLILNDSPSNTLAAAVSMKITITAYDGGGHIVTTSLIVQIPRVRPDPCVATNTCASNVLFLPGLEASRLYRPDYAGGIDQLWEPNTDGDGNDLLLTADGKSVRNDVYTKDVIDEVYSPFNLNIYKSFFSQMNELKTAKTITDWKAIPYDWRLSLDDILNSGNQLSDGRLYYSGDLAATSSPYIIQELRRLAKSSKTGKVTIIAHSNGGLVTKALTERLGNTEAGKLIDKIIFVAVPQAGTPTTIGAILHGYGQGIPPWPSSFVLTVETARTLAKNMSSAYNLLPSASYFTHVDNPVVTFDNSDFLAEFRARYGSTIHDGVQLKNFIADTRRLASSSPDDLKYPSVGNATLLSRAEALHTAIDAWVPPQGVSLYEVAGWGENTLATIEYSEGRKTICTDPSLSTCPYYTTVPTLMYSPKEVVEGDGTVVVPSALWSTASTTKKYWVDLKKYNNDNPIETLLRSRDHSDILEVPELRTLLQNILTNSTSTTPLAFITTTQPATDAAADKRLRFVLHSPLNLSATDNFGNTVNSATSTIPGSRWRRYGEVQVLTVPENTPITLNLDGYATGSFTLDMQEIDGSNAVIASSTLSAIPSATSTRATMAFTDGTIQNASPLLLDYDGNGTTDFSLKSKIGKEVMFDITPPEATITFDPISQRLKVVGIDNLSSTTVSSTATSTVIIDEAGNTMQIIFKKFKQEKREMKLEIQELRYNGVATTTQKTTLEYEWSVDKTGKLKELEEKAMVGSLKIEGHYDAKKNVTRIEEKVRGNEDKDEKESKKTLSGLVIINLSTNDGKIGMSF